MDQVIRVEGEETSRSIANDFSVTNTIPSVNVSVMETGRDPVATSTNNLTQQASSSLDKKKKATKLTGEVFMTPELLNRTFPAPKELDLFGLETGARKTISELFKPMMDDMEKDRRNVAGTKVQMGQLIDRIVKLEYICSMQGAKPKVFQDLDNRFIELEITIQSSQADILAKVDANREHNQDLKKHIKEVENQLQILNNLIMVRDKQLAELRELTDEVRMTSLQTKSEVITRTGQIKDHTQGMITNQELIINTLKGQIAVFDKKIEGMQTQVQKVFEQQNTNAISILKLGDRKLDTIQFDEKVLELEQKMEKIRYATYDTFRVQKSTDNYIEKYLPFVVQNMISQNMCPLFKKRPIDYIDKETGQVVQVAAFGKDQTKFSKIETFEFELYDRFKQNEYQIYKERHAVVLNDLGLSQLKKSSFKMPGYKRIVGETMNEYEFDNEILNKQFNPGSTAVQDDLQYFIPEEISNTECSFDADEEKRLLNSNMESESGASQISLEYNDCINSPGLGGERTQKHVEKQQVVNIDLMMRDSDNQDRPRSPFLDRQLNIVAGLGSNDQQSVLTLHKNATQDSKQLSKKFLQSPLTKQDSQQRKGESFTAVKQPKLTRKGETEAHPQFHTTQTTGDLETAKKQAVLTDIRRKTSKASMNLMRYPSLGGAVQNKVQSTPDKGVERDLYNERRQATGYRVGFDDLERPVTKQIHEATQEIYMIKEKIKELQKEIIDYKKYLEVQNNSRDNKFQTEVRECLTQQLTYINEIQNEMLKEIDVNKKQFHEINWQMAKIETSIEEVTSGNEDKLNVSKSKASRLTRGSPRASPHMTNTGRQNFKVVKKEATGSASVQQEILMKLQQSFSGQTSELEIDFIKLQNIVNFELLKKVKQIEVPAVSSEIIHPVSCTKSRTDSITVNSADGPPDDTNSLLISAAKDALKEQKDVVVGSNNLLSIGNAKTAIITKECINVGSDSATSHVDCNVVVQMIDNVRNKLEILLENNNAQMQATITNNDGGTTQVESPQQSLANPHMLNNINTITSPIMSHDTLLSTTNMNTLRFSGNQKNSLQVQQHQLHHTHQGINVSYQRPQSSKQLRQKPQLSRKMLQTAGPSHQAVSSGLQTHTHNQVQKLIITATNNSSRNGGGPKKIGLPLPLVNQSSNRDTMSMQCSNRSNGLKMQLGVL